MLPKQHATDRSRYLQNLLQLANQDEINLWPMPTKDDFTLVGALVILYSYVDFNLRRIAEACDYLNRLPPPWKDRTDKLNTAEIAQAVQSVPGWSDPNLVALKELEEFRGLRNLVAYFVVRRFPTEDALLFVARNAKDFKRVFGADLQPGQALTAVVDVGQMKRVVAEVENIQLWLAKATVEIEKDWPLPTP
jgi:hypothetical protein